MKPYVVYLLPPALQEVKTLPGHIRQRVKRAIDSLAQNPKPPASIELSDIVIAKPNVVAWRLKIDKWRIIYAIDEMEKTVDVLTVRQRPPYDYGDLEELIAELL